ncbi:hypothetical protein B9Z48_11765 [Limnohabitans sp. WS1]|nr:hypothetical protein B9Z48_11765 [Limnohabitans sp. WS1]
MARTNRVYVSQRYTPAPVQILPQAPIDPIYIGNNYVYVLGSHVNPNTCKIGSGNPTDRCAAWNRDTRHVLRLYIAYVYEVENSNDAHIEEEKAQSVYEFANQNPNASVGGQEFFAVPPDQLDIYLSQAIADYKERKTLAAGVAALAAERDNLAEIAASLTAERDSLRAELWTVETQRNDIGDKHLALRVERDGLKAERDTLDIDLQRFKYLAQELQRAADGYFHDRLRDHERYEELREKLESDNKFLKRKLEEEKQYLAMHDEAAYFLAEGMDRIEAVKIIKSNAPDLFNFYKSAKIVTLRACDIHRFVGLTNEELSEWGLPDSWHFSATTALLIGAGYDHDTGCYMTPEFREWLRVERNSDPSKENRASYFKKDRTIVGQNTPTKPVVPVLEPHPQAQSVLSRITASAARFFA